MRLCFAWPRPETTAAARGPASGGYLYDERVVAALRKHCEVSVVEFTGALEPSSVADATALIIDGLGAEASLPALPRVKALKVGLIHMAPPPNASAQRFFDALDVALFVSDSVLEDTRAAHQLPARVAVATPGVDHVERRKRVFAPRVVGVGHVLPHKGVLEALEVFAALAERVLPPWTASWLGALDVDHRYAERVLERRAALGLRERVDFAGRVTGSAVVTALSRSGALVSTSWREAWGLGAAEALALGVPLAAWTRGGVFAQASTAGAGVFVERDDVAGLAKGLASLLTDETVRARCEAAAFGLGASLPSWDDCARKVLHACT